MLDEIFKGSGELVDAAGIHGFYEDRVRIVVVENNDVLGDAAGGVQENTGMVAENSA